MLFNPKIKMLFIPKIKMAIYAHFIQDIVIDSFCTMMPTTGYNLEIKATLK